MNLFPRLGFKLPEPPKAAQRIVDEKRKARDRKARKAKNSQRRHMQKLAA